MNWILVVDRILDLAIFGLLTVEKAQQIKAEIDVMRAEGRDPTDEEVELLFTRLDAAIEELKGHSERLNDGNR